MSLPCVPPADRQFAEDRSGGIWVGFWGGGLARYRRRPFHILLRRSRRIADAETIGIDLL